MNHQFNVFSLYFFTFHCTSSDVPFTVKSSRGIDADVSFTFDCFQPNHSPDFCLGLQLKSHMALLLLMNCSAVLKSFLSICGVCSHTLFTSVKVRATMICSWATSFRITPCLMALSTSVERNSSHLWKTKPQRGFNCYMKTLLITTMTQ